MSKPRRPHWRVTVAVDGEEVLTIESECLSGIPDIDKHADIDPYEYMVTDFIDAVRNCLKAGGFASKDKDVESGGTFLVGYAGRLFVVYDDYQVGETANGMAACGCGADYALGSLFSSTDMNSAESRVRSALSAAEQFSAGVRAPFFVEALYAGS